MSYNPELAARYQQVRQELESGTAFPTFVDICAAYRDTLDKQHVQLQLSNALQDYPLPPEQQADMLAFVKRWDGDANTLVHQLEQVAQQVREHEWQYFALCAVVRR